MNLRYTSYHAYHASSQHSCQSSIQHMQEPETAKAGTKINYRCVASLVFSRLYILYFSSVSKNIKTSIPEFCQTYQSTLQTTTVCSLLTIKKQILYWLLDVHKSMPTKDAGRLIYIAFFVLYIYEFAFNYNIDYDGSLKN